MTRLVQFSPKRCCLLIRNDIFINRSRILITTAAVWVLLIFLSAWDKIGPNFPVFYQKYYFIILSFSGVVVFGGMFKDLHHKVKGADWLTTPASIFEKLVSRTLLGAVILTAGIMAVVFLSSLTSECVNYLLFGSCHPIFNPFREGIFLNTIRYFILLSPLFLGAVYFKKSSLFKTFLSVSLYQVLFGLTVLFILRAVYGLSLVDFLFGFDPDGEFQSFLFQLNGLGPVWSVAKWTAKIGFWWVLAPICWVTAYVRLKETEA